MKTLKRRLKLPTKSCLSCKQQQQQHQKCSKRSQSLVFAVCILLFSIEAIGCILHSERETWSKATESTMVLHNKEVTCVQDQEKRLQGKAPTDTRSLLCLAWWRGLSLLHGAAFQQESKSRYLTQSNLDSAWSLLSTKEVYS
jgi:hypothetical protein